MSAEDKLIQLIKARCPVIGIQSVEPARVVDAVFKVALQGYQGQPRLLFAWTVSRGLYQVITQEQPEKQLYAGDRVHVDDVVVSESPESDAFAILEAIVDMALLPTEQDAHGNDVHADVPAIYILQDIHPYLQNPAVLRALRDVAAALVNQRQTVILLSPNLDIPVDARKEVKIIDWPLPDRAEIEDTIDLFVETSGCADKLDGGRDALVTGLQGLTRNEADQVLSMALVTFKVLDERAVQFVLDAKADIIRESGALEYFPPNVALADVGGLENLKAWLVSAGHAQSERAREFGIKPPRGVLVVGVPGGGKSLTAKMLSALWHLPLVRLDVGALFGSLMGESEGQTRNALRVVSALGKCILWIDEIEKALGSSGGELDGGTSKRVLSTILTWMEEHSGQGVFVFATANDIDSLRPELIRRFSEVFFVDLPGQEAREEILRIHIRKTGRDANDFAVSEIAAACAGFTGHEIEDGVVQQALWRALKQNREVTTADMLAAAGDVVTLAETMPDKIAKMRAWATRARPASNSTLGETKAPRVESGKRRRKIEV